VRSSVAERVTLAAQAAIAAEAQRLNAGPVLRQLTIKINLGPSEDEAYIDYQGSRVKV
jgi:hypothetical protein